MTGPADERARHLFLKGRSGAGKSTCLLSCLTPVWKDAGGFLTRRLTDSAGETAGFCLVPVEGMEAPPFVTAPFEPGLDGIFIERTPEGWKKHPEVFETLGTEILGRILANPERYRFCYLDEIGGVELGVRPFMERLERLLCGPLPCVGVVKASGNLAAMGTRVPVSADTVRDREWLEARLKQSLNCRILPFTDKENGKAQIKQFMEQHITAGMDRDGLITGGSQNAGDERRGV